MSKSELVGKLEEIRDEATGGLYDEAISALDHLLVKSPDEIEVLRLKGNVLELRALDFAQYRAEKLLKSRDYVDARGCYERILELDSHNTLALADLGDHYKNLDAFDRALEYYIQVVRLLEEGESRLLWREEVQEILDRVTDFPRKAPSGKLDELEEKCRSLLDRS